MWGKGKEYLLVLWIIITKNPFAIKNHEACPPPQLLDLFQLGNIVGANKCLFIQGKGTPISTSSSSPPPHILPFLVYNVQIFPRC